MNINFEIKEISNYNMKEMNFATYRQPYFTNRCNRFLCKIEIKKAMQK